MTKLLLSLFMEALRIKYHLLLGLDDADRFRELLSRAMMPSLVVPKVKPMELREHQ